MSFEDASLVVSDICFLRFARSDAALFFPEPAGTSRACKYMSVAICLMRGFFILFVLIRCEMPA